MACLVTNNIEFCNFATGGVKSLFIGNKDLLDFIKVDADGKIEGFFVVGNGLFWWLKFDVNKDATSISERLEVSRNGNVYLQEISTSFVQLSNEKRQSLEQLSEGVVVVLVEDYNGKIWCLGAESGLELSSYTATTDVATAVNAYNINLQGYSVTQMREVSDAADIWAAVQDCSVYAGQPLTAIPPPLQNIYNCLIDFSN